MLQTLHLSVALLLLSKIRLEAFCLRSYHSSFALTACFLCFLSMPASIGCRSAKLSLSTTLTLQSMIERGRSIILTLQTNTEGDHSIIT